ncbi:MAG: hypothetical protein HYZ75_08955 [Elusimicrobia bacterium]|nr:hypothetical protein [Elusimicrobiota bacterium]
MRLTALLGLLLAASPAGAQTAGALSRDQALDMMVDAVKGWGVEQDEVRSAQAFINDRSSWGPELKAAAGVAEGAMVYLQGMSLSHRYRMWRLNLGTPSGQSLNDIVAGGNGRLASIGLGLGQRWSAEAVLGLREGRFNNDSLRFNYTLKFD